MAKFKSLGSLAGAFGKQPMAIGRMNAPAMELHPDTMTPMDKGPIGLGKGLSVQSPAQHMAVEKAAQASGLKRKKGLL